MEIISIKNQLASQPSKEPSFSVTLKSLSGETFHLVDPKATRALLACMNMEAVLGGAASHWGGPAAFAEIMSALYGLVFSEAQKENQKWYERFHLINDAGHCENGLYALKANYGMAGLNLEDLKKFRSVESFLTGHGESHLFPEGVYLSNGPLGSTVAQAQGLAMADKLLNRERMCIVTLSDGACMEGEVKESFAAIPGFAKKNQLNPFLLIISDNNTKLSGRIDQDSFSLEPTFKSLKSLGWDLEVVPKGNDLKSVFNALERALQKTWEQPQTPSALVVKTCKGFGVKSTMESSSGGHGFPLKKGKELKSFIEEIYEGQNIPSPILQWCEELTVKDKTIKNNSSFVKVQSGVDKALTEKKQEGKPLVSISSDLYGSTGVGGFRKNFPESSFDVGVAEANMISVAVGFSKQGFIPVVDTFAQFAVTKGSLPLIMSALSQAPMIGIFSHVGFQDAADGASHQALSYIAKTFSLPHTEVYNLSCADEAYAFVSQAIEEFYNQRQSGKIPNSKIFFLGRETFPKRLGDSLEKYQLRKPQLLFQYEKGKKPCLIVATGALVYEALQAAEQLKKQNQGVIVINNSSISHPDISIISPWLKICEGRLLTVEDHQYRGGMSSLLISELVRKGNPIKQLKSLCVQGEIGRSAYSAKALYQLFGLDSDSIVKAVLEF